MPRPGSRHAIDPTARAGRDRSPGSIASSPAPSCRCGCGPGTAATAGPADGPTVVLRSRRALRRHRRPPGRTGAGPGLRQRRPRRRRRPDRGLPPGLDGRRHGAGAAAPKLTSRDRVRALVAARCGSARSAGRRSRRRSRRGSSAGCTRRARDRAVIAHHYDLSNEFYELILDESMAYSSAYFTEPDQSLADAQRAKLDLICRKLRARAGHAAARRRLRLGLADPARRRALRRARRPASRCRRSSATSSPSGSPSAGWPTGSRSSCATTATSRSPSPFDAVASIEMGEHVGEQNYPTYVATLHRALAPGRAAAAAADVAPRRHRARRGSVHRGLHRARHAHAPGVGDARLPRAGRLRDRRRRRTCARTTCDTARAWLANFEAQLRSSWWRWPASRSRGCGGCIWSAAR